MITLDDWAEIRRLHRLEGVGIKTIARRLGVARNTVKAALVNDRPPAYHRGLTGSVADYYESAIALVLKGEPSMPATVIARKIDWPYSSSLLRAKVASMRPLFTGVDPTDRTVYVPGDRVQCDLWFPEKPVPVAPHVAIKLPVLTMVTAWCGFIMGLMIPTRKTGDLLAGMWRVVSTQLGAVPHSFVWDREAGIGVKRLTSEASGFAGTLGSRIIQVRANSPEHKGVIERCHDFLEQSFEPGRSFTGPDDFNIQLADWLVEANQRTLRRTGQPPADLIDCDRSKMGPLPPVSPLTGFTWRGRLGRDYYVRVLGNDYSVDPSVIGRIVQAHADLDTVTVTCGGVVVAQHRRVWTTRSVITDAAHKARAAELRTHYDQVRAEQARQQAAKPGHLVALRSLDHYDQVFALPEGDRGPGPTLGVVK